MGPGSPERTSSGGVQPPGDGQPAADSEALLADLQRGDPAAFEALAAEHGPRLFRFALHLTGRREEAEDLMQEALVRALPALRSFEGRAQVSTYLCRALTNLWKNRLRSRSRSRIVDWLRLGGGSQHDEAQAPFDPPDPAPSAEARLSFEDVAARVRRAVLRLDPDRRLVLLLREVEEMSYEEIATVTAVPVGTVRSRLARARDELRELLGGRP